MEQRKLGNTDILVGAIGLGCWAIGGGNWGDNDDAESIATIVRAVELGSNWIDTAPAYNFGHSEEVVGRALKQLPRDKVIVSTKCGLQWLDGGGEYHFTRDGREVRRDLSPKAIRRDLENSLRRLGTDYVDILYTHWQCKTYGLVPVAETMGELMELKREGLIRAIGACNVDVRAVEEYLAAGQLDTVQDKFSILDRAPERELLPLCQKHGITLQCYSPIEQGLLSGRVPNDYCTQPGQVRHGRAWWETESIADVNAMLASWGDLTAGYGCTTANLCIRWNSMLGQNVNVLCGARKVAQVEENVHSMAIPLSRENFARMKRDADECIRRRNARLGIHE